MDRTDWAEPYEDLWIKAKARADAAEAERDKARAMLFPYADATEISDVSFDGKYLIGDKKSIGYFHEMMNRGLQIDVYARAYDERIAAAEAIIASLTKQLAEAREGRVTRAMIDRLVEAELDYALSCTNGGAPSSEKQQELSRELAEAQQAVRATLSRHEKQEGEA